MRTFMKNNAKGLAVVLSAAMVLSVTVMPADAKAKKPKLSTTKVSMKEGAKKKVTVKNAKKVTWSLNKAGKKVVSLSKKSKKGVTIKAKKAGKAKITAKMKYGKKTLKKKITVSVTKKTSTNTNTNTNTTKATPTPTPEPTATPTPTPTETPRTKEVKDIVITYDDFQKAGIDADFASSCAIKLADEDAETPFNLLKDKDDRFDLKYFESVTIEVQYDFIDEDTSSLNGGKIALCLEAKDVTGFEDGDKFTYGINPDETEYTLEFGDEDFEGQCAGLNFQTWDGSNDYGAPECLEGITVKKITFNARKGAEYPTI